MKALFIGSNIKLKFCCYLLSDCLHEVTTFQVDRRAALVVDTLLLGKLSKDNMIADSIISQQVPVGTVQLQQKS